MTPAQAAWLRKLRDEGPQHRAAGRNTTVNICQSKRWTFTRSVDFIRDITPEGLAALAAHEEKSK